MSMPSAIRESVVRITPSINFFKETPMCNRKVIAAVAVVFFSLYTLYSQASTSEELAIVPFGEDGPETSSLNSGASVVQGIGNVFFGSWTRAAVTIGIMAFLRYRSTHQTKQTQEKPTEQKKTQFKVKDTLEPELIFGSRKFDRDRFLGAFSELKEKMQIMDDHLKKEPDDVQTNHWDTEEFQKLVTAVMEEARKFWDVYFEELSRIADNKPEQIAALIKNPSEFDALKGKFVFVLGLYRRCIERQGVAESEWASFKSANEERFSDRDQYFILDHPKYVWRDLYNELCQKVDELNIRPYLDEELSNWATQDTEKENPDPKIANPKVEKEIDEPILVDVPSDLESQSSSSPDSLTKPNVEVQNDVKPGLGAETEGWEVLPTGTTGVQKDTNG